jgi:hypothetical protein
MTDYKEEIKTALEDIPGLQSLSDSWPESVADLPAIVVDLAGERGTDRRDNVRFLTEQEFNVRIFGNTPAEVHTIFEAVVPRMETIRYELTYKFDQNTAGALQTITRWTRTIPT